MDTRLSIAMIVRDEAENIQRALDSVRALGELVAEVCVYDTGSVDGTAELAEAAGARVERGSWDDDFSRARNAALDMCRTEWVLMMDADEVVQADEMLFPALLELGVREGIHAFHVLQVNTGDDGTATDSVLQTRLLRPAAARYVGRIHEQVDARHGELVSESAPQDVIRLHHSGYAHAERTAAKLARNSAISQQALADPALADEERSRIRLHHARSIEASDPSSAEAGYRELAAEQGPYQVRAQEHLAHLLLDQERWEDAALALEALTATSSNKPFAAFLFARWCLGVGELDTGLSLLRELDQVWTSGGVIIPQHLLYTTRARVADELGLWDEALSCRLTAMASPGAGQAEVDAMFHQWGARPADPLMQLLREVLPVADPAIEDCLHRTRSASTQVARAVQRRRYR
ncbi:Glycosyl transferase family 2 [Austwickia chelonae]|uniref:Glycosyltransferase 2-like domain-containing protein n=1 Tax=Austwickia chelonae NBRC 105200 TaxID=1184607 RepID=K6VB33_9MICO|nr:glycosyltransferase family 2 protein [Austwickia chelonae]GAB79453.1 hypothetical protein AUCHE_26_00040 [Austwickia chelonae NBRC 105200]SEV88136.1 Glycosyl transferase family 2 [Austwickia chelonae]